MSEEITEEDLPPLKSEQQKNFVLEYLKDLNGTQSAIRAGYAESDARSRASKLLSDPNISQHIQYYRNKSLGKIEATVENILEELAGMAFARIDDFLQWEDTQQDELTPDDFESMGEYIKYLKTPQFRLKLKNQAEISQFKMAGLESIKEDKDGAIALKLGKKKESLELLGKHVGMFKYEEGHNERDYKSHAERIRGAIRQLREGRAKRSDSGTGESSGGGDR